MKSKRYIKVGVFLLISLFWMVSTSYALILPVKRPSKTRHIFDYAGLISDKNGLEAHINTLYRFADIEMVVVTLPELNGEDIDSLANRLMSQWEVGKKTKGFKGILFLLALNEKLVRFEVGYDLEKIYPDGFVGYIEHEQMKPFFELRRVSDGIAATLEMIIARAYDSMEKKEYQKEEGNKTGRFFSGGAGAKRRIEIGSVKVPKIISYSGKIREYLSPQPTPALALLRNIEKNRRHIKGYNFELYTEETRRISKKWVFTTAQMDNEVRDTEGKSFKVYIRGNRAICVFPPRYRRASPYFLIKSEKGWQLDIASMSRLIHFDMRNRFHMTFVGNPYLPLFKEDYTFDVNGFMYYKDEAPPYIGVDVWDGSTRSARIYSIVPGSPADQAGLKPQDTIIAIGNIKVKTTHEIVQAMNKYKIGDRVTVKVIRNGKKKVFSLILDAFNPYRFCERTP